MAAPHSPDTIHVPFATPRLISPVCTSPSHQLKDPVHQQTSQQKAQLVLTQPALGCHTLTGMLPALSSAFASPLLPSMAHTSSLSLSLTFATLTIFLIILSPLYTIHLCNSSPNYYYIATSEMSKHHALGHSVGEVWSQSDWDLVWTRPNPAVLVWV